MKLKNNIIKSNLKWILLLVLSTVGVLAEGSFQESDVHDFSSEIPWVLKKEHYTGKQNINIIIIIF